MASLTKQTDGRYTIKSKVQDVYYHILDPTDSQYEHTSTHRVSVRVSGEFINLGFLSVALKEPVFYASDEDGHEVPLNKGDIVSINNIQSVTKNNKTYYNVSNQKKNIIIHKKGESKMKDQTGIQCGHALNVAVVCTGGRKSDVVDDACKIHDATCKLKSWYRKWLKSKYAMVLSDYDLSASVGNAMNNAAKITAVRGDHDDEVCINKLGREAALFLQNNVKPVQDYIRGIDKDKDSNNKPKSAPQKVKDKENNEHKQKEEQPSTSSDTILDGPIPGVDNIDGEDKDIPDLV
jgi:hypothetical protein